MRFALIDMQFQFLVFPPKVRMREASQVEFILALRLLLNARLKI